MAKPMPSKEAVEMRNNISRQVEAWREQRGLEKKELAELLSEHGCALSETDINKRCKILSLEDLEGSESQKLSLKENYKFGFRAHEYFLLCELIGPKEDKKLSKSGRDTNPKNILELDIDGEVPLEMDARSTYFKGYLGRYFACYYSTKRGDKRLVTAELTLSYNQNDDSCDAHFSVEGDPKIYRGKSVMLVKQNICYCILHGKVSGELCMVVFDCLSLNSSDLGCLLGVAVTVSAGATRRRPTIHRMLISRKRPTNEQLSLISAHLLLNKSYILIQREKLLSLVQDFPELEWILPIAQKRESEGVYYRIEEEDIKNAGNRIKRLTDRDIAECICRLRNASVAEKNNKISTKGNEWLLEILSRDKDE